MFWIVIGGVGYIGVYVVWVFVEVGFFLVVFDDLFSGVVLFVLEGVFFV